MDDFLHKTIGPLVLERFVIASIVVFFSGWTVLLGLIFFRRWNQLKWEKKRKSQSLLLQKQLYSLLFEDFSPEEWGVQMQLLNQFKGRPLDWSMEMLLKLKRQYTGACGARIIQIFEESGWEKRFQNQMMSNNWHKKSKAIRILAEMNQTQAYDFIQPNLFHSKEMVRDEAAVALIRLKGFKAILDLQLMDGKISTWSQIQIIQALKSQEDQDKKWIYPLLTSTNGALKQLGQRLLLELDPTEYVNQKTSIQA